MLNNEKIILMTNLSLYEQKNQKEIKTSKYFRGDYMSLKMLKSFLCITVAYLLCLVLWFMYKSLVISSLTTTGRLTALIIMLVIFIYCIRCFIYDF